jgi:hypothetical protein
MVKSSKKFKVDYIFGHQKREDGIHYYKVKWTGYPKDDYTWEPECNFGGAARWYIEAYESRIEKKNKALRSVRNRTHKHKSVEKPRSNDDNDPISLLSDDENSSSSEDTENENYKCRKNPSGSSSVNIQNNSVRKKISKRNKKRYPNQTRRSDSTSSKESDQSIIKFKLNKDEIDFTMNIPKSIKEIKNVTYNPLKMDCLVEFKRSSNNRQLLPTWVDSLFLKQQFPQILVEYYESRVNK